MMYPWHIVIRSRRTWRNLQSDTGIQIYPASRQVATGEYLRFAGGDIANARILAKTACFNESSGFWGSQGTLIRWALIRQWLKHKLFCAYAYGFACRVRTCPANSLTCQRLPFTNAHLSFISMYTVVDLLVSKDKNYLRIWFNLIFILCNYFISFI